MGKAIWGFGAANVLSKGRVRGGPKAAQREAPSGAAVGK